MIHRIKRRALLLTGFAIGLGLPGLIPCATAGTLTVSGSLSATGNLSATSITLNDETITNFSTGNLSGGVTVLGSPVLDFTQTGYYFTYTLTGDTAFSFTNHVPGRIVWLKIAQDTNGGWNATWPSTLLWPNSSSIGAPPLANHFSVFKILDDGTYWLARPEGLNYGVPCVSNCNDALQFDGSQNYVSVPAVANTTTNKTVEFWAQSVGTGNGFYAGSWNDPYEWLVVNNISLGQWYLQTATGVVYVDPVPSQATDGAWHHYAFVEQSGTVTIYIDGTYQASGTASLTQTATFNIGAVANGYVPYTGLIDEFRISNVARYTNSFDSCGSLYFTNDANTVGLWHFDEGAGTTTADGSGNGNTGVLTGSPLPTWVTGANCSGSGDDMDMMGGFGGSHFSFGSGGSSGTTTSAPTGGSSMTITDTLGRIWGLIH